MNQIRSFYMISMFTINTKIDFCISFFCKFYVFENEIKVCLKFYLKIIFTIWSLYAMICIMVDSVGFFWIYDCI